AAANALPTTVDLGTMRVGSTVNSALAIQNIAADTGGFTETLAASFGAVDSGLTGLGSLSGLGNSDGVSHAMSVAFNAATTGTYNGSATVDFVSEAVAGSGLDDLQLGYLK